MVSDLEQMENIVNQFLAYARHSQEKQVLINFGDTVTEALENARLGNDKTIELQVDLKDELMVYAHPLELSRAVQNLFTNAQRYGRSEDGILRLHVNLGKDTDGKTAVLRVADEGRGLPVE